MSDIKPDDDDDFNARKKAKPAPKRTSAEILQRRKEGRLKAAATMANNLKKTGIGRFEDENNFAFSAIRPIPLINQKNYFTDYLKKDEQVSFIRNWRAERLLQQKIKNLKKDKKEEEGIKNFDTFDLNEIEAEMKKRDVVEEEDEEEEENDAEEGTEEKAKQGFDTFVIHPGSANIRIGRATDSYPVTIPTVIAVRDINFPPASDEVAPKREVRDGEVVFNAAFDETKAVVTKDFKSRMRFYKRRMLPNSRETAANFNKKQEPEQIPDHNDPAKKDWIDASAIPEDKQYYVGEEALKLPIGPHLKNWRLRYPILNGKFNEQLLDYRLPQELLGDLDHIVSESLQKAFEIDKKELASHKAILVIPDLYDKVYVETWVDVLFKMVGFGRVGIIQESVAATFGAGATCACVIDVGAQTTSIACVDEGMIINDSRILLNYGGDHITEAFTKLLLQQLFPYKDINLNSRVDDYELAQNLKHDYVTFQDADIAVQLYNYYKRKPGETTEKFDFKVFDEVMLAPLGVFYPELFQIGNVLSKKSHLFPLSTDQYSGKPNNPYSKAQEGLIGSLSYSDMVEDDLLKRLADEKIAVKSANPYAKPKPPKTQTEDNSDILVTTPLEKAIIESITSAGLATDLQKVKKLYDNLLIVGGGFAKISGFDLILNDRINIWRPKFLSTTAMEDVINYVTKEKEKVIAQKKALTKTYKENKKEQLQKAGKPVPTNVDDVELSPEEVAEIDASYSVEFDLDHLDALSEKGQLLSVNVLPPPREFDPEMLTWKGGSVYGRLKVVNEMWVTYADWDLLNLRCLYYKSLFNY